MSEPPAGKKSGPATRADNLSPGGHSNSGLHRNLSLRELNHRLLAWFFANRRDLPWREEHDPYRIWISEIMLQQTSSATVAAYYPRWLKTFPDIRSLDRASLEEVLKAWEGLGYYVRARNLHRAARLIQERRNGRFPQTHEEIRGLPGVGDYTAAAVASIAFALPFAAVDGNVIRVVSRLLADGTPVIRPVLRRRVRELVTSSFVDSHPGWVNQAWMELGALICLPMPKCPHCPLSYTCSAFRQGRATQFPVKAASRPLPVREQGLLLIVPAPLPLELEATRHRDRAPSTTPRSAPATTTGPAPTGSAAPGSTPPGTLLRQLRIPLLLVRRPDSGLLGGLWELPNFPVRDGELRQLTSPMGIGIVAEIGSEVRQRYSHFEVRFQPYLAVCRQEQVLADWVEQRWVQSAELERYPRPKAHIKAMQALGLCER